MTELSISLEWILQEEELKPQAFSKNHIISINDINSTHSGDLLILSVIPNSNS